MLSIRNQIVLIMLVLHDFAHLQSQIQLLHM